MSDDDLNPAWVPDACTLPTADRPLRRVEFDDLLSAAVEQQRVTDQHVRFVLPGWAGLAERLRDLAARETECCSFFSFTVTAPQPDRVVFDVEVPVSYIGVLDALVDRGTQTRAGR